MKSLKLETGMRRALVYAVLCLAVVVIFNGLLVYFFVNFGAKCCSELILKSGDIVQRKYADKLVLGCRDLCSSNMDSTQSQKNHLSLQDFSPKSITNNNVFLEKSTPFITLRKINASESIIQSIYKKSLIKNLQIIVINSEAFYAFDTSQSRRGNNPWDLQEVSFQRQKGLIIEEIAWNPRAYRGLYLVTWEIDGGGLKGHLLTDSARVTLSLWPDTLYYVQVEVIPRIAGKMEKSDILTVDTRRDESPLLKDDAVFLENKSGDKSRNLIITFSYLTAISLLTIVILFFGILYRRKMLGYYLCETPCGTKKVITEPKWFSFLNLKVPLGYNHDMCCDDADISLKNKKINDNLINHNLNI